ncbi:MAG: hypothetical protein COW27_00805 [Nitrosopumilales archaeon CG15_BIG_FIL_POST_REV_8_21_14_020_37_12]|nr:MAG: hypothetical protein COW27_00805 [Nitrosopumilales archaeon CG15_BIG_FIL_POST_REV_8_21_14_020_37_12]
MAEKFQCKLETINISKLKNNQCKEYVSSAFVKLISVKKTKRICEDRHGKSHLNALRGEALQPHSQRVVSAENSIFKVGSSS